MQMVTIDVLEEQTELHTGIFNVVTIRQFLRSASGWSNGVTVTHRHARDGKGNKTKELRDNVPHMRLAVDDDVGQLNEPACATAHQESPRNTS